MLEGKKILLVITGGIAAYKSLELIRLLQVNKASVVPVMTKSSQQFVTHYLFRLSQVQRSTLNYLI